eukprot:2115671-Pleurochrysis_carterae.AAC.2
MKRASPSGTACDEQMRIERAKARTRLAGERRSLGGRRVLSRRMSMWIHLRAWREFRFDQISGAIEPLKQPSQLSS